MAQGNLDRETHEDRKPHHRSGLHLAGVGPTTRQENESQTSAPLPAALIARPRASQSRLQNPPPRPQVNRYPTTSAKTRQFSAIVKIHQPLIRKPDSSEAVEHLQTTHHSDKLKEWSAVRCDVLFAAWFASGTTKRERSKSQKENGLGLWNRSGSD